MASLNKAILIGFLGKDPESRFMPNGDAVCNFSIATSETWKDKNTGEKKEITEWHRIGAFGKLAEICGQYLKKGSLVYLEGRIQTRKWTDKEGVERYTTEIKADQMKMLGGKGDGDGGGRQESAQHDKRQSSPPKPSGGGGGGAFDDMDDDIPFISCAVEHDLSSSLARRRNQP